tara:strand:- start:5573 stop:6256 length:684 start_codon:yes stop_codon:yes gene_type:complete
MRISFSGKNILVTGGTRGIGLAISNLFEDLGGNVIPINTSNCNFQTDNIEKYLKSNNKLAEIDILINNAGINKIDHFQSIDEEDFIKIMKVNVEAPMRISKYVIGNMVKNNWGRILNIASVWGTKSIERRASYSTSKAAIKGLTRAMAIEFAKNNILINTLSPGFIDTELTSRILSPAQKKLMISKVPISRMAQPEEIANTAAFLCSDYNTYITGQDIVVDGGFLIS